MRQAGRYLPQYRAVRARTDFLTMLRTPELAVEVTLQPVDVLGVDAAIIFSDILVVPEAMGMTLRFEEGVGPILEDPLRTEADLARLRGLEPESALGYQLEAIRLARRAVEGRVPLIGFAGGSWTLASYMIEGGGSRDARHARRLIAEAPGLAHTLLDRLTDAVTSSLVAQAAAGAQVLQVFESRAATLGPRDFAEFVLPYLARVTRAAGYAGAPIIVFVPGTGWALEEIARVTGAHVVGVDYLTSPETARRRLASSGVALQGNLDPAWLHADPTVVRERTGEMIAAFGTTGYVANLGQGILPDVPLASVQEFVATVQAWT
jgi:uroporphyrinogen decarboxylase